MTGRRTDLTFNDGWCLPAANRTIMVRPWSIRRFPETKDDGR